MNVKMKYFAVISAIFFFATLPQLAGPGKDSPVDMSLQVAPEAAGAGQEVQVTLELTPRAGYKLNKYPRISLKVAEVDGVVAAAAGSVGSSSPPPPDKMDDNYFKTVDPLVLNLKLADGLSAGSYEIPGKLKYYYCVKASGYCAPMRVDVTIPVTVK